MVEIKETENAKNNVKTKSYKSLTVFIAILLLIGGAAVYIQKNPKILDFFKHQNTESDIVTNLQSQIDNLNLRLNELEKAPKAEVSTADLAMLNDKINIVSDFNQKILDSKADTSHVLGLMGRVDELDNKVKNLGKVSSQGALVLTASMLVKDNAYKGPFEYEAEVLKYLAIDTSMEQPAEEIYKYAQTGVKCKKTLIKEFNLIYDEKSQKENQTENNENSSPEPVSWKDKLNSKLSELIVIERINEKDNQVKEIKTEDEIYKLVNDGFLELAVEKMKHTEAYNTPEFNNWSKDVMSKEAFDRSLRQLEALTLAFMKAESLRQE